MNQELQFNEGTPEDPGKWIILRLEIKNILGIEELVIEPAGNMVELTGETGQGKSSVLRTLASMFKGAGAVPKQLLRKGELYGFAKAEIGDVELDEEGNITKRIPRREVILEALIDPKTEEQKTPTLTVNIVHEVGKEDVKAKQTELNAMGARFGFDFLELLRKDPKKQVEELLSIVNVDIDLDRNSRGQEKIKAKRKVLNKRRRDLQGIVDNFEEIPPETPDQYITTTELLEEQEGALRIIQTAEKIENDIASKQARLEQIPEVIEDLKAEFDKDLEILNSSTAKVDDWEQREIERIKGEAKAKKKELGDNYFAEAQKKNDRLKALQTEKSSTESEIIDLEQSREEIGDLPDVDNIRSRVESIDRTNEKVRLKGELLEHKAELEKVERRYANLKKGLARLERERYDAMKRADLPVEGMEFREDGVYINDIPLAQCSGIEQLQAVLAIPLRRGSKFPLVIADEADQIAGRSYAIIEAMITESGAQLWYTTRRSIGPLAIPIEDGKIKK